MYKSPFGQGDEKGHHKIILLRVLNEKGGICDMEKLPKIWKPNNLPYFVNNQKRQKSLDKEKELRENLSQYSKKQLLGNVTKSH